MSLWYRPNWATLRRAVAVLVSLGFLLPVVSWAFTTENYLNPAQEAWLGGPGSRNLAMDYSIPTHLGKIVAAHNTPGSMTFILFQDLHCNAEIQANIRNSLDILINRHPDIRLIAEEGASGIIPILELATIPDSAEKRAVMEYFVRQGKMTASDWYVISGHPEMELYGAEDANLYTRSLELIRNFSTEENNGLLMELVDHLDMLAERNFNKQLLSFERRRKYYQKGTPDLNAYYQTLVAEARKLEITLVPDFLPASRRIGNLDYYTQTLHQQYLESEIQKRLTLTTTEQQLLTSQQYIEIAERILNVSASQEDLVAYQAFAKEISFTRIAGELEGLLGTRFINSKEEIAQLEQAVQQAREFYHLADQRDQALLKNAMQRAKDRKEQKVVLITGGYHTQAIQDQIQKLGHSFVTIQPNMTQMEATNNYFELLRNPERPTELENLITQSQIKPSAIQIAKATATTAFRASFRYGVTVATLAKQVLNGQRIPRLRNVSLRKTEDGRAVVVATQRATYYISLNKQGLFIAKDEKELKTSMGETTDQNQSPLRKTIQLPSMRIAGLALAGLGTILLLNTALVPFGVVLLGAAAVLLGAWNLASFRTFKNPALVRRTVVMLSCFVGSLFLITLAGPLLCDVVNHLCGNNSVPYFFLDGTIGTLKMGFSAIFSVGGLHVYNQDPTTLVGTGRMMMGAASILFGPAATVATAVSMISKITLRSTEETLNGDDFYARDAQQKRHEDHMIHGQRYARGEIHNAPGSHQILDQESIEMLMDMLVAHELRASDEEQESNARTGKPTEPNRAQPTIDRYHQVKMAVDEPHIDNAIVDSIVYNENKDKNRKQFLLRVAGIDLQFFGSNDFVTGDFTAEDTRSVLQSYFSPTATAPKLEIIGLLLEKMGIKSTADLMAAKPDELVNSFMSVVNFFMDETDLLEQVDYKTLDYIPEVGEMVLGLNIKIERGAKPTKSEIRQVNRALIEVLFPKQTRASRPTGLARQWVRGFLNIFNAMALLLTNGEELGLVLTGKGVEKKAGLLDKAGDMRPFFESVLLANAKRSSQQVPLDRLQNNVATPEDEQLAVALNAAFVLHEMEHLLVVHVPWKKNTGQTDAEWQRQSGFSISALQNLYLQSKELLGTNVFTKNAYKAFHVVRGSKDSVDVTKNAILTIAVLETYNDRSSMFLWENYFKLQSYRDMIQKMGARFKGITLVYEDVDTKQIMREQVNDVTKITHLLVLEDLRRSNRLQEAGFTAAEISELDKLLKQDELRHPYIQAGDIPLIDQERTIYRQNWELAHHFALKGELGVVSQEHFDASPFVKVSVSGRYSVANTRADLTSAVEDALATGHTPVAAFSIAAGEVLTGQADKRQLEASPIDSEQQSSEKAVPAQAISPLSAAIENLDVDIILPGAPVQAVAETTDAGTESGSETGKRPGVFAGVVSAIQALPEAFSLPALDDQNTALVAAFGDVQAKQVEDTTGLQSAADALAGMDFEIQTAVEVIDDEKIDAIDIRAGAALAAADAGSGTFSIPQLSQATSETSNQSESTGVVGTTALTTQTNNTAADQQANIFSAAGLDLNLIPGETGMAAHTDAAIPGLQMQAIPSFDYSSPGQPGINGQGIYGMGRQNDLDLPDTLGLPANLSEQGFADQRAAYILGRAEQMLQGLGAGDTLTLGFDSPELANRLRDTLDTLAATEKGKDLASRIQVDLFPADANGQRAVPSNWSAANGVAVLSAQGSNLQPVTLVIDQSGEATVAVQLSAINMAEAQKALAGQPGWDALMAAHAVKLGTMRNQSELAGYLLVNAASVKQIQERQPELLNHLVNNVIGFQEVSAAGMKLPIAKIKDAMKPSFEAGAKRVVVDVNVAALRNIENAQTGNTAGMILFGMTELLMTNEAGYNANTSFLRQLFQNDLMETAPLDMLVDQDELAARGVDKKSMLSRWFEAMKRALMDARGERAAKLLSEKKVEGMADDLMGLDMVTLTMKSDKRLGQHLKRMRGQEWRIPTLFFTDPLADFRIGRMVDRPRVELIDAWNPKQEETAVAKQKPLARIISALLLGFAASILLMETAYAYVTLRDSKGRRIPFSTLLKESRTQIKFMWGMALVVMTRGKVVDKLSRSQQEQYENVQSLIKEMEARKMDELEQLRPEQVEDPQIRFFMQYDMPQLVQFKNMLKGMSSFRLLMWFTRVKSINSMLPEMFLLLSESNNLQNVMYTYAPEVTLRRNFALQQNLHPELKANLMRTAVEARLALAQLRVDLEAAQAAAEPDYVRLVQINSQIRNARFSLLLNRALENLGQENTSRNTRQVVRALLRELGRRDIADFEEYQRGILKVLTMIEPLQQAPVQIRQDTGRIIQLSLPMSLYDSELRDILIYFMDVFSTEGKPLEKKRREVLRAGASA